MPRPMTGPMGLKTRDEILAVATDDETYDEVGLGRCSAITFGTMNGSMDFVPTIQIWHGDKLAAEFNAHHATRITYK